MLCEIISDQIDVSSVDIGHGAAESSAERAQEVVHGRDGVRKSGRVYPDLFRDVAVAGPHRLQAEGAAVLQQFGVGGGVDGLGRTAPLDRRVAVGAALHQGDVNGTRWGSRHSSLSLRIRPTIGNQKPGPRLRPPQ